MKVAIYDKWLNSLGGGEKVATVMAEVLVKRGHEVHLISNFEVEKHQLEEKMGVNLSKIKLIVWYERSYAKLTLKSKYDLFINVSFLDHLPSKARNSVFYIHFPTPVKSTLLGFIKYETILPHLRKFLIIPEVQSGINPIDDVYTRGGRWLSKKNTVIFSNTPTNFNLTLRIYAEQLSLKTLENVNFNSPNASTTLLDRYIDHEFNVLVYKLKISSPGQNPAVRILVNENLRTNALGLVSMTVRDFRFVLWNFIKRYMPRYEMALYGSGAYKVGQGLDTYKLFLANSAFTSYWTKKYWRKDSKILYPPVDTKSFKPGKKRNIILNVGRFFVGGHSKRQDILVATFKKMVDTHKIDNTWELTFVGGIAGGKDHSDYVNKIREESRGYPINFYFSASFKILRELYSQARIYWHATGYEANENIDPIKLEHFGITPVEAMAAGVVPLVYEAGGLTETVGGDTNLTWKSQEELISKTTKIIKNPKLLTKLSREVVGNAKKFSKENFAKRFASYLDL
jgi:glycosyltransferase involved in cell wall biosynthesis